MLSCKFRFKIRAYKCLGIFSIKCPVKKEIQMIKKFFRDGFAVKQICGDGLHISQNVSKFNAMAC